MNHFGSFDIEEYRQRIRLLRKLYGMKQIEFAAFMGIDYKKWNHYENGYPISRKTAQFLLKELPELTVDWIWFGNERGVGEKLLQRLQQLAREDRQERVVVPVKVSARRKKNAPKQKRSRAV